MPSAVTEGTSSLFGVALAAVFTEWCRSLELSHPECGTVAGIIVPPDVRFAGGSYENECSPRIPNRKLRCPTHYQFVIASPVAV
jgi:hypothetical protein